MLYSSISLDQGQLISNADEYEYQKESIHRFNPVPLIRIERLLNQPIDSVVCTWLVFDIDSLLFIHIIHLFYNHIEYHLISLVLWIMNRMTGQDRSIRIRLMIIIQPLLMINIYLGIFQLSMINNRQNDSLIISNRWIISCNRFDRIQMEQSLKHTVFSVIVLQLNRSRYMKSLCWIIVLAVIYHCTVLHNNLLPNYCRNPCQSITLMHVNVESALYNHHPITKRILRVRMGCALNSNIAIFSFLCVY